MIRTSFVAFTVLFGSLLLVASTPGVAGAQFGGSGGASGPGGVGAQPGGGGGGGGPGGGAGGSDDLTDEMAAELHNEDPAVRLFAVKQLSISKDEKAVEYLIEACSDTDTRVRLKAIDSLGNMRATGATPSLVQILYLRESEPWLKQRVLVALGKIGDSRAARPVADLMSRETDLRTVGTAIFALGELGDTTSIKRLEAMAEKSDNATIDRIAADAVAKINRRKINPEIEILALRPDPNEIQRPASAGVGNPLAY